MRNDESYSPLVRSFIAYSVALSLALAALVLRWNLIPVLGPTTPFVTLAIIISAWFGGLGPGLATTLVYVGVAIAMPHYILLPGSQSSFPFILSIVINGGLISLLLESL